MRRFVLLIALFLATHGAGAAGPRVVNLMPDFWAFWGQASALAPQAQARAFVERVAKRHPDAYAAPVIGLAEDKDYDEQAMRRYLRVQQLVGPNMDLMRELSDRIGSDLQRYERHFRASFPDLAYDGEIYFMYSLGGFDGGTRTVKGRTALLFGLDMITYVYGKEADPEPFFDHELFHIYHHQFEQAGANDGHDSLAAALWREGLATYVAQTMNPSAHGVAIFGLPRSTPARVRAQLPALAKQIRGLLDSTSRADYARYFLGGGDDAPVPARAGYVVGYLVAQQLGQQYGMRELARMPMSQLRPQIEQALLKLEQSG